MERFANLDPIDFEHMVVKSSEDEGVPELETLIRLYGIIQKDQVKFQILQQARVGEFADAARTVQDIADIGRAFSATSQDRLHKLRWEELYESDQLVNSYNDPLRNGDLFEIGEGEQLKLWVLIAQPCDLMVRSDGKRVREDNFKVAVLVPLRTTPLGEVLEVKDGLEFPLVHFDHNGAQSAIVRFGEATPANLQVLDFAIFNKDGCCHLSAVPDPAISLPSQAWKKRDANLRRHFGKVTNRSKTPVRTTKTPSPISSRKPSFRGVRRRRRLPSTVPTRPARFPIPSADAVGFVIPWLSPYSQPTAGSWPEMPTNMTFPS